LWRLQSIPPPEKLLCPRPLQRGYRRYKCIIRAEYVLSKSKLVKTPFPKDEFVSF
jgi:hypothetical protein